MRKTRPAGATPTIAADAVSSPDKPAAEPDVTAPDRANTRAAAAPVLDPVLALALTFTANGLAG